MAVPLVVVDEDGKLSVPTQTLELLQSIPEPVAVVTIAGPYRSGKSFLLNCLSTPQMSEPEQGKCAGSTTADAQLNIVKAFPVGPSVNPCTRGLWLHQLDGLQRTGSTAGTMRVLYVDSEGMGAIKANTQTEINLLSLGVLISSLLIFNSFGAIDEASIGRLSFVSQLAKSVHVNEKGHGDTSSDFDAAFPAFLWVLRDFNLQLRERGSNGAVLTEREYLERSLRPERGIDEEIAKRNRTRMLLTTFFPRRDCATLQRPIADETALAALCGGETSIDTLRTDFVAQVAALRGKVSSMLVEKRLKGSALTGTAFATMLMAYIDAINEGSIPCVQSAWGAVAALQGQAARSAALATFHRQLATPLDVKSETDMYPPWKFPEDEAVLRSNYANAEEAAWSSLAKDQLQREPSKEAELRRKMSEAWEEQCAENCRAAKATAEALVAQEWALTQDKLLQGNLIAEGWHGFIGRWQAVKSKVQRCNTSDANLNPEIIDSVLASFGNSVVLSESAGIFVAQLVSDLSRKLEDSEKARQRVEEALSSGLERLGHVNTAAAQAANERENALRLRLQQTEEKLQKAERDHTTQSVGKDAEMIELRLRSEFRDKEVARLSNVIERLQEKTHAHVSAMNAELRQAAAQNADQARQLAVLEERLRTTSRAEAAAREEIINLKGYINAHGNILPNTQ